MSYFEIGILFGMGLVASILWDIRSAVRKTHDLIIDAKIEKMKQDR